MYRVMLCAVCLFALLIKVATAQTLGLWPTHLSEITKKSDLVKLGETTFSVYFWDIYKAQLSTSSGTYPIDLENDTLVYEIEYLKPITAEGLVERTVEQWQHLGLKEDTYQAYLPLLLQMWPNIKAGDTLSLVLIHHSSGFYHNQKYIGSLSYPQFGIQFVDIWLAKNTSQPQLRNELLGSSAH